MSNMKKKGKEETIHRRKISKKPQNETGSLEDIK